MKIDPAKSTLGDNVCGPSLVPAFFARNHSLFVTVV